LDGLHNMEVAVEAGADKAYFKSGTTQVVAWIKTILFTLLDIFVLSKTVFPYLAKDKTGFLAFLLFAVGGIAAICFTVCAIRNGLLAWSVSSPQRFMQSIGKGVLRALKGCGSIFSQGVSVGVDQSSGMLNYIYLKGGTEREKDVFAQCVYEMFGPVDNPRYLLRAKKKVSKRSKFYCVPELFGKKKEEAALFVRSIAKYIGPYELVYTRGTEGKEVLLGARIHSLANRNPGCVEKRKRVKNAE